MVEDAYAFSTADGGVRGAISYGWVWIWWRDYFCLCGLLTSIVDCESIQEISKQMEQGYTWLIGLFAKPGEEVELQKQVMAILTERPRSGRKALLDYFVGSSAWSVHLKEWNKLGATYTSGSQKVLTYKTAHVFINLRSQIFTAAGFPFHSLLFLHDIHSPLFYPSRYSLSWNRPLGFQFNSLFHLSSIPPFLLNVFRTHHRPNPTTCGVGTNSMGFWERHIFFPVRIVRRR
jgi:hypothetical protein